MKMNKAYSMSQVGLTTPEYIYIYIYLCISRVIYPEDFYKTSYSQNTTHSGRNPIVLVNMPTRINQRSVVTFSEEILLTRTLSSTYDYFHSCLLPGTCNQRMQSICPFIIKYIMASFYHPAQ